MASRMLRFSWSIVLFFFFSPFYSNSWYVYLLSNDCISCQRLSWPIRILGPRVSRVRIRKSGHGVGELATLCPISILGNSMAAMHQELKGISSRST